MHIHNRTPVNEIIKKAADYTGEAVLAPGVDSITMDKRLAFYISINQLLLFVMHILALLSKQGSQYSSNTTYLLKDEIAISDKISRITAMLNSIQIVLQGVVGIVNPLSEEDPKAPTLNPTIKILLAIYDDSSVPLPQYKQVYRWAMDFCKYNVTPPGGASFTNKSVFCPIKELTIGNISKSDFDDLGKNIFSTSFIDLNLDRVIDIVSRAKKMEGRAKAAKALLQQEGQTRVSDSFRMQSNASEMSGTLKGVMKTLSTFANEKE